MESLSESVSEDGFTLLHSRTELERITENTAYKNSKYVKEFWKSTVNLVQISQENGKR